jgi:phosphatidyl-myo-inositol dimannoside synthase
MEYGTARLVLERGRPSGDRAKSYGGSTRLSLNPPSGPDETPKDPGREFPQLGECGTQAQFRLAKCFRAWQTRAVIIGLFTELDGTGGVQRAGRHLASVLSDFAASQGMECRILSLNDSRELHRVTVGKCEFVYTGSQAARGRFSTSAIRTAMRRAKLVLAGHPNLGPVVRAMGIVAPKMQRLVCTHGIEVWEPMSLARRGALKSAHLVLAPSKDTADHVATHQGVDRARIRVLPWGLDPQFEALLAGNEQSTLPQTFPRGRVILAVGRWLKTERYKGMDTLITALPRLLIRWPEAQLALVGTGDDREWLAELAMKNGVKRHVHFLSDLSPAEIAACYGACEIFALPSSGEGFGFVYLEAMAMGKPVIGGAHGGVPEVIEDGVCGYLVQHGDPIQLATSIEALLADPEHARKMGERGRQRVDHEFRFKGFAKTLKRILREQCES